MLALREHRTEGCTCMSWSERKREYASRSSWTKTKLFEEYRCTNLKDAGQGLLSHGRSTRCRGGWLRFREVRKRQDEIAGHNARAIWPAPSQDLEAEIASLTEKGLRKRDVEGQGQVVRGNCLAAHQLVGGRLCGDPARASGRRRTRIGCGTAATSLSHAVVFRFTADLILWEVLSPKHALRGGLRAGSH